MLVNKVTKMHYLFFFFVYLSVRPSSSQRLHRRVFHCSLSFKKNIFLVLVGKITLPAPHNKILTSHLFSRPLTPFHDDKSSINTCIWFFLSSFLDLFCSETSSEATDRWFVYQNIDLFSLYTSTCALLFVHFVSFSPLLKGSPDGPSLSWHRLGSRWQQEGQERDGAVLNSRLLCLIGSVSLCLRRSRYLIGPFHQNFQLMSSFMWRKSVLVTRVSFTFKFRQANIPRYRRKTEIVS